VALTRNAAKARILVVDDHPIVREGIALLVAQQLDLQLCAEAADIQSAMQAAATTAPDIALVDVSLGEHSGLELIEKLHAEYPKLAILALSMHDEQLFAERALRSGASGYIMKGEGTELLMSAIRRVIKGDVYVSPSMSSRLIQALAQRGRPESAKSSIEQLSNRELEVFRLIGLGKGTREIALQLHLSMKTIETHRAKIKQKLGLKTAGELVVHAVQWSGDALAKRT
jgi:DNA-binding NarL/FixJ family response regulator